MKTIEGSSENDHRLTMGNARCEMSLHGTGWVLRHDDETTDFTECDKLALDIARFLTTGFRFSSTASMKPSIAVGSNCNIANCRRVAGWIRISTKGLLLL